MFETMISTLHLLGATLGLLGAHEPAAVAVVVALAALTVLTLTVLTLALPAPDGASAPHPRRAIDLSSPLSQSDPDAPGHPRPRAPQFAAPAA
jgi:hypothetical protein